MHPPISGLLIVLVVFAFLTVNKVMNTWIRAKHGYPLNDRRRGCAVPSADDVAGDVKRAVAERDATIAKLEERVRVLERIVTDDSKRLANEIDALRT
jgi:hypothetical protein